MRVSHSQVESFCSPVVSGNGYMIQIQMHRGQRYHTISSMSASWKCLIYICSVLCFTRAVSGQFQLEPLTSNVLKGSDARFSATIPGPWQAMSWFVGERLILSLNVDGTNSSSSKKYGANFCSTGDTRCVEFIIHNTTRNDSGLVTCAVLGDYGQKTAQLNVQERGTVSIPGGSVTVMQDQQVEFQCVTSGWFPAPVITWNQNGEAVNSSLYNTTSMADGDFFKTTSVLTFQAVRISNTTVQCLATVPALTDPASSSVFLAVVPKPTDWTVLIAVVVSFGSCALLVLLIIGIVFCCKRRKETKPNYQDEISRRVRTQSELSVAGQRQGRVNQAYLPDGQTSVAPSVVTNSDFFRENSCSVIQMPDIVNSHHTGDASINVVDGFAVKKHRHMTIV